MTGLPSGACARESLAADPTIEEVLQGASLELDRLGLDIEHASDLLAICLDCAPADLRADCTREFESLALIAGRLHALAGMVGLLRPGLGPRGGVDEALGAINPRRVAA